MYRALLACRHPSKKRLTVIPLHDDAHPSKVRSVVSHLQTATTTNRTADSLLCRLSLAVTTLVSFHNVTATVETLALSAVTTVLTKVELTLPRAVILASVLSTLSTASAIGSTTGSTTILGALNNLTSCVKSQVQAVNQALGDKVVSALGGLIEVREVVGTVNTTVSTSKCQVRDQAYSRARSGLPWAYE